MRIAQRGTSNVITTSGGAGATAYLIDRFITQWLSTDGNVSVNQQTLGASDTPYQYGFRNSQRYTVNVPLTIGASTYILPGQNVEGYNITDLNWGTSFGSPVTLSFWFRSNLQAGSTFPIALRNSATTASYVSPFSIVASGTWQYVTLTVPPPPNGTAWNSGTTSTGITLAIGGWSVPITTSTVNTWLASGYLNATGTVNWFINAGNFIEFTGVQLEKGTLATPFEVRPFATELQLCQRYFTKLGGTITYEGIGNGVCVSATNASILCPTPVPMRDISSLTNYTINVLNVGNFQLQSNVSGSWAGTGASAITRDRPATNGILLAVTVGGGLSLGSAASLTNTNSTGGVIQINNEL